MTILYTLAEFGVVRFNEMKKYIGSISYKTLSSALKELEADKLVLRKEYPQIPPKVEYSLTTRGETLIPILDSLCQWGTQNRLPK
jgi:DNA-binding HxlR family transcriptional regulator